MNETDPVFLEDIQKQGTLCLLPLCSSIARGKVRSITPPPMEKGYGIIKPEDIPGDSEISFFEDRLPLFAQNDVSYQGQTVLLIYGPQEEVVREIRDSIKVEYETDFETWLFESPVEQQILKVQTVSRGKVQSKTEAAMSREDCFQISLPFRRNYQNFGAFAWKEKDVLHVSGATQWPFFAREIIAKTLKVDEKSVRFSNLEYCQLEEAPLWYPSFLAVYAALGTWLTGKPCRLIIPPEESLFRQPRHAPMNLNLLTGLNMEGRVQFRKISLDIDAGAFAFFSNEIMGRICLSVLGAYPQGNAEVTVRLIKTSTPPLDGFSNLCMAPGFAGLEAHVNRVARQVKQDPVDRKLQICLRPGKGYFAGELYTDKADPSELLSRVEKLSDFHRKFASYEIQDNQGVPSPWAINFRRGIGVSLAYQGNGFLNSQENIEKYSLIVRLDTQGVLTILTSGVPGNPRTRDMWKESAAKILQISPENVRLENIDTALVPDTGPALFSRNITVIPRLIEKACIALQKKRFRAPLPLEIKKDFRLPSGQLWDQQNFQGHPFISLSWAAAAVELQLSPVSLIPRVRNIWMAIDCGKVINPSYARAAVEAGIYSSLSWCLNQYFPGGNESSQDRAHAKPLWRRPIPITIDFIENSSPYPGGLGELPDNTIPGAFLSAMEQALGRDLPGMPYHPGDYLYPREEPKTEPEKPDAEVKNEEGPSHDG